MFSDVVFFYFMMCWSHSIICFMDSVFRFFSAAAISSITGTFSVNDFLTGLLGPYQEIRSRSFSYGPSLRGPCVKVRASYFLVWTE